MHIIAPPLQRVPSALLGFEHNPVASAQVPTLWHSSRAMQTTGLVPVHVPAWQVSVCVQELPSVHEEPFAFGALLHIPVAGLHVP
jgi:hypothetical protein